MNIIATASAACTSGNTTATTAAIDTTGANLLAAVIVDYDGVTSTIADASDSKANTWTPLTTRKTVGDERVTIWYSVPTSVGSGHTFTASRAGTFPSIHVVAATGALATPFDVENGATTTGTTIQPGSITPSTNGTLIITGVAASNEATGFSIGSGFTQLGNFTNTANHQAGSGAYLVQNPAAAINPTWTAVANTTHSAAIAAFKANPITGQMFAVF